MDRKRLYTATMAVLLIVEVALVLYLVVDYVSRRATPVKGPFDGPALPGETLWLFIVELAVIYIAVFAIALLRGTVKGLQARCKSRPRPSGTP